MNKTKISTMGSFLARKVLNVTEKMVTAITSKVPCQRSKTYVESLRTKRPWMIVPMRKAVDAMEHCQPVATR